jgi:RimJ/RimL family protein N-acetyltransferase
MTAFPIPQPTLNTARLILRPFTLADAPDVQRHVSDRDIAAMTLSIPHPYPDGGAAKWIATHAEKYAAGALAVFAIIESQSSALAGSIGLTADKGPGQGRAELGYWIAKTFWGRGYATEAGRAIIAFGFQSLGLNKIHAAVFTKNPASHRVIRKIGMQWEGRLREHDFKWGVYEDIDVYGVLAKEWKGIPDSGSFQLQTHGARHTGATGGGGGVSG